MEESEARPLAFQFISDIPPTLDSVDEKEEKHIDLIQINCEELFERLLREEDQDQDKKITIKDPGPKNFTIIDADGGYYRIKGVYPLSNLLQELALMRENRNDSGTYQNLSLRKLYEKPVTRINRIIREYLWQGLTRTIDLSGIHQILADEKISDQKKAILYIPHTDTKGLAYFSNIAIQFPQMALSVTKLPEILTPEYIKHLNDEPGLLSLALTTSEDGEVAGAPFVVPGGRFNEMYGWDSYFESLGLLEDRRVDLAKGMVDNFVYQITHYGKILNANRSYYLTRSQPPFLSSMVLAVWENLPTEQKEENWLRSCLNAIIKEYQEVWDCAPRKTEIGLSRYFGTALKAPPEVEDGHFDHILEKYAKKLGLSCESYMQLYQSGKIEEAELDMFFLHDQSVRESGHDTSYRLDGRAAHLITVDLNSLLFKYEVDVASMISEHFQDGFIDNKGNCHCSQDWVNKAAQRQRLVNKYLWDDENGTYFDYDISMGKQTKYESATMMYPMWAGMATTEQAARTTNYLISVLEQPGGLASTSERSRGPVSHDRPQKQWDYPFGWAPHQMMSWTALKKYGYKLHAQRLAYKWLLMITENYVNYNGVIPEKYDVVRRSHDVFDVEYGNVGTEFEYITKEGFGWMNASFQVGLTVLEVPILVQKLNELTPSTDVFIEEEMNDYIQEDSEDEKMNAVTIEQQQFVSSELQKNAPFG